MIHEEDEWCTIIPDNLTLFKCELGKTAVDYLWELIEEAQENPQDFKPGLAGNISECLLLKDRDDYFFNNHLKQAAVLFAQHNPNVWEPQKITACSGPAPTAARIWFRASSRNRWVWRPVKALSEWVLA